VPSFCSVGYGPETKVLEVEFNSDMVHAYFDVPQEEYDGLMTASSKGSYMHRNMIECYGDSKPGRER
jgi:hypothetical protein